MQKSLVVVVVDRQQVLRVIFHVDAVPTVIPDLLLDDRLPLRSQSRRRHIQIASTLTSRSLVRSHLTPDTAVALQIDLLICWTVFVIVRSGTCLKSTPC